MTAPTTNPAPGPIAAAALLATLPAGLRDPLLEEYRGLTQAFSESRWKLSTLDAGRFCEVVYSILLGALSGTYPTAPSKPSNFPQACRALENHTPVAVADHSLRVLIPRVLPGIYDVRNNRNVGHVGGDVVSNKMDAAFVRDAATWVMAELVRIYHGTSIAEAQAAVDALAERRVPLVWEQDSVKRVLDPSLSAADRALVLLHSEAGWCPVSTLHDWVKYKHPSRFRSTILRELDEHLKIEFDTRGDRACITPLGTSDVEARILTPRSGI